MRRSGCVVVVVGGGGDGGVCVCFRVCVFEGGEVVFSLKWCFGFLILSLTACVNDLQRVEIDHSMPDPPPGCAGSR